MKSSYLRGLNMASFFCASKIIVFVTFTLYVLLGNTISASRVFVTVSLYTAVRLTVTLFFPSAIEKLFESRVSIKRIQVKCYNIRVIIQLLTCCCVCIFTQSSLLSSILGELPSEKGILRVKGQLTYAAQQPWVFPGTIRSNILFGKDLEPQMYERVIKACALKRDLELLPDGDQTLIGDRGATLSGGQKARVNLARCICGLLKNKPRILVTHQLQYLKTADQIFVLKEAETVQTVPEESRAQGTIGLKLYLKYLRAGANLFILLFVVLLNLLAQSCLFFPGLTAATILFGFMRNIILFTVLVKSAQTLHNTMFNAILRAPVRFFDINPIGRVLNRFSKDIGQVDSMLPWTFTDFIQVRTDLKKRQTWFRSFKLQMITR
ncbi:hypothetical protein XENOCAPTIV_009697 [Xenoophorus captivus]|uniref:ABC transmembrane type-1 domain-containing protein n=1 Tax=Xenoophorus captivus TaxID=1517983 RepID=A0ABV0RUB7_9TELE